MRGVYWVRAALVTYVVIGVIVFGHAFHRTPAGMSVGDSGLGAIVCAVVWPLYVSARFWSPT